MVYEYPYNFSNGSVVDGLGTFIIYVNSQLNGALALGFIFLIWMVTFLVTLSSGSRKAFAASGFVGFIFSVYFTSIQLISPLFVVIFLLMTIIGATFSAQESY